MERKARWVSAGPQADSSGTAVGGGSQWVRVGLEHSEFLPIANFIIIILLLKAKSSGKKSLEVKKAGIVKNKDISKSVNVPGKLELLSDAK